MKLLILFLLTFSAHGKVDPPNYNFSLDQLQEFTPGTPLETFLKKYPKAKKVSGSESLGLYKAHVDHLRYYFPVFVQVEDNKIVDFFAKLPQYFLHNVFHYSLVEKLGMQNVYKKVEAQAVYIWKQDKLTHVYTGACTITCFPIYYTVFQKGDFEPLIKQFENKKLDF